MDITKDRFFDDVIVLGSGLSINNLTSDEIEYINKCKTVIAINKFMAFYKKSNIIPTHVYFQDSHDQSFTFLKYIFSVCKNDKLENLTFIIHSSIDTSNFYSTKLQYIKNWIQIKFKHSLSFFKFKEFRSIIKRLLSNEEQIPFPKNAKIIKMQKQRMLENGGWATSFHEPLFHFRGSLSSVLNLVTIIAPGENIYLVGTDFGGPNYFYEEDLNKLDMDWKDWTYDLVKTEGKHFSAMNYNGTNMFQIFPKINNHLKSYGNNIFCNNPESLLVKKNCVKFKKLIQNIRDLEKVKYLNN